MIEDDLIITQSATTFLDNAGRINVFWGGLSLDESQSRGLLPLLVLGLLRRTTDFELYQYKLPAKARIDNFLATAWGIGGLGGAPNLLWVQPGLYASQGKQLRRRVRTLSPKTKIVALSRALPSAFEENAATYCFEVTEGSVDDSFSGEEIIEVINRRERITQEMRIKKDAAQPGFAISESNRKRLLVDLEPYVGAVFTSIKGLTDGHSWCEIQQATNLLAYGQEFTISEEDREYERIITERSEQRRYEERYLGSLYNLREALKCLPFGRTEAFEDRLPEFGLRDFLEGDDHISGDMARAIHQSMKKGNVLFPTTIEQFVAALNIVTDDGSDLVAFSELTSREVTSKQYRFLITAQDNSVTTLYCLQRATIRVSNEWLEKISAYIGVCEIQKEAMIALMELVELPMSASLSGLIPKLVDCILVEDPEWPNYP
ncbi:hypothetical protein [Pseudomonas violetae]|uniref:Uncharacterized protein n=1 Tax=Pseudomonas violetae TaxID=2915813 RepID=A0ABT0EUA9_9PSED|nr:hypothetical protein [Pseudomonas violetae]MCK1788994.1 hypothetical protein [Pseudomonas violetae]